MATIVQPYNPWREQLALTALGNIAGDIIGDMWKTHRQNEQNKKINAFRGELQNLAQQQQGNISLAQPQAPQGYNSNPWASALHQSYSPLTQFDIGTAGIGKTPSLQDITRNADTLAASKRFSMLSPETVKDVRNSMMQNAIASMFGNASDVEGRMNALTMGAANGVVAPQVLTAFSPWAGKVYFPFTFDMSDLGKSKDVIALNSHTGQANTALSMPVTVSPNEAARNAASMYSADRSANAHIYGSNSAAETARQRLEHDRYTQMMTDYDNQLKGINDEITAHLAVMDTLPNDEARAAYRLSKIAPLEEDKARIIAERNDAQARYRNALGFGTGAGQAGTGISRSDYDDIIAEASKTHGVDQDLIYAVAQIESGHKNGLTSNKGAQGVMQLMPDTAKRFGVTDVWNPKQNINAGVAYLKWLLDRYGGNEEKALQAYNCGEGRVARDGTKDKNTVPAVSVQYAKNVLAIANKRRAARRNSSQPQNTPNVTAVGNLQPQQQNTTQTTQQVKGSNSTAANQGGVPYLVKDGDMLTLEAFDKIREQGNYDPETLFNILTEQKGWQLATSQSTPKVPAVNEHTPQNITNTEPVTQTKQSPPQNWPFALPGRPQYPQGWNPQISDVVNWINSHKNNENPFGRPPVSALTYSLDPRNKPHYYFPGNVWQGLTPNIFSDLIDGEYFLDPRMH